MLTTDLALRFDPVYEKISRRFYETSGTVRGGVRQAWFKLTHRDMGPIVALSRPAVPKEALSWQDPIPAVDHPLIGEQDIAALKAKSSRPACPFPQLVSTAWASASTFRGSDKRGGANGARIRLAPQKDWDVNQPAQLARCCRRSKRSRRSSTLRSPAASKVSLADLIVLGGCAAIEKAAKNAGHDVKVPFTPGRTDASQEQTDVDSFAVLEPVADGFRNYLKAQYAVSRRGLLVDKAQLLTLTAPEMTVLVGGLRVLDANVGQSQHGVFTKRPETLTNDFFVNLLDMGTQWKAAAGAEGRVRRTRPQDQRAQVDRHASRPVFGSNAQLRALRKSMRCAD